VKCGVGCKHSPGLFDRIAQEFSPSGMLSFWHFVFSLFSSVFQAWFSLEKKKQCPS
jgi:hypothetical protein